MLFNSPLSSEKADRLIELLELQPESRVIDAGCGTGEFLTRVVARYQSNGIGVDTNEQSLTEAKQRASKRSVSSRIQFVESDVRQYQAGQPFDCGICIGASHAFAMGESAYPTTLRELGELVRPGGMLLIGESFWSQPPPTEYLEFIGEPVGTYRTHQENVELASEFGFVPHYVSVSNLDEWDDFEWSHNVRLENQAESLDEPDRSKLQTRSRQWRAAYLRWGRGTMAFAYYLFRKPIQPS